MVNQTFHHHEDPEYHKHILERGLREEKISQCDYDIIKKFIASKSVTNSRKVKLAQTLVSWQRFFTTSFDKADIDDIHIARNNLENAMTAKGVPFTQNGINDHIKIIKNFYRWMIGRNLTEVTELNLKEIKAPGIDLNTTQPEELLTFDEITKMVSGCKSHRDRAMIFTLYETGCRIKELCSLKWKYLVFDDNGTVSLRIPNTKNEKVTFRHARLIMATEYLAAWRNHYNGGDPTGDNYIFCSYGGEPLQYRTASQAITRAAERAGMKKRVHCHLFRKSRITGLVKENYQESIIKEMMWGNAGTNMFKVYVKLGEDDIDREVYKRTGIDVPEEDNSKAHLPRQCKYCFAMNAPGSKFCHMCLKPLSPEAASEQTKLTDALHQLQKADPAKFQELMIQVVSSMGV